MSPNKIQSIVAALLIFLPPSLLLGCVSPLLVVLTLTHVGRVGRTTGTLYAIGSVGNVLGVLVTDYVLLLHVELSTNVLAMGCGLGLIGLFHLACPIRRLVGRQSEESA